MENLSDRMKVYENMETSRHLMSNLPTVVRLDGVCFHRFCRDLNKPYDKRLIDLMISLAKYLAIEFNASSAYTQSDEISLVFSPINYENGDLFGGRIQKLNSILASKTSVKFNKLLPQYLPEKVNEDPCFDSRIFNLPNLSEAANTILWREIDAFRNSVQMAGQHFFSHRELQNKNGSQIQEMLFSERNINYNDYPNYFKRGTFIQRRRRKATKYTGEEVEKLPPQHEARKNPDLMVERNEYIVYHDLPPFSKITNREGFLFFGNLPEVKK